MNMPYHWFPRFIYTDDLIKEIFNAPPPGADCRNNRYSQQLTKRQVVKSISLFLKLIVHVESNNNLNTHINQLSSQIKVPFQIGSVNNIDYYIGFIIENIVSEINFFGRITLN